MSTIQEFVDLMLPAIEYTPTDNEKAELLSDLAACGYTGEVKPFQYAVLIDLVYKLTGLGQTLNDDPSGDTYG